MSNEIEIKFINILHESELPYEKRRELSKAIQQIFKTIKNHIISFNNCGDYSIKAWKLCL